jgi:hypothetical protein
MFPGSACPVLKLYFNDVVSQLELGKITLPMEERGMAGDNVLVLIERHSVLTSRF